MAFQPIEDTAQAVLRFTVGTADPDTADWVVQETHYWRRALGWTSIALDSLGDEIAQWWIDEIEANVGTEFTFHDLKITDVGAEFGLVDYRVLDNAGSDVAQAAPVPILAEVIQWVCDAGQAPRRGRTFFGLLDEDNITNNIVSDPYRTTIKDAYDALRGVDVAGSAALVIPSRFQGFTLVELPSGEVKKRPTPRDPALTNTIASVSARARVGKQSKRR